MTATCLKILLNIIFVLALMLPGASSAQKMLDDFKKPLPVFEVPADYNFESKSKLHEGVPFGDEALSYNVRLPSAWEEITELGVSEYSLSNKILGEVAKFYGPPRLSGVRSKFTIQALRLDYQLTAEQWFLQYLLANGYAIQGMEAKDNKTVEAIYVFLENDVSYVVRATAHINGKRVVLAQYFLPVDNWEEEKIAQAKVASSFTLTKPENEYVEEMKKYHFLDIAQVEYPSSWEIRAGSLKSIDVMGAELLNIAKGSANGEESVVLNGRIEFNLMSVFVVDSFEAEKENFKSKLTEDGLVLNELLEVQENFTFHPTAKNGKVEVYKANDQTSAALDYELWLATMEAGDYYYFITLLTPSRDADFFVWSRNTETFKLVVSLTSPQDDSLTED